MDLTLSTPGALRRGLSAIAVAATVPYLTLKLLWLSGSTVGFADPANAHSGALWTANLVTFGMDAAAVLLALAFVRPWGRRVPAGLLAFPMWVATGLLGTLLVALPIVLALTAALGSEHSTAPMWLEPWVFAMVYGGFAVQGITLIGGFLFYARERWAGLLRSRIGDLPRTATLTFQRALACVATVLGLPTAVVQFYWAAGGRLGLPAAVGVEEHRGMQTMSGVVGVMLIAACAAVLTVVFRVGGERPLRPVLATAWVSAGSAFAWGAWTLFAGGLSIGVADRDHTIPGFAHLIDDAQTITGLLLLMVGSIALIEHSHAMADVESVR